MGRSVSLRLSLAFASLVAGASSLLAAAPVLEGLPQTGQPAHVPPIVPVAKALVLPVTAHDADGDPVRITVTSSNPKVMVRVKTGNPLLKFRIQHDGDGTDQDPAYTGDLVFQLFRELTPETAAYIAGFAQSGYYDGVAFHRFADLHDDKNPATPPAPTQSFIFQGGDPATGGPGFQFDNEFAASLIFAGRGQLAMANAGYNFPGEFNPTGDFGGTNGSQFFITDGALSYDLAGNRLEGRPRHLDFGHTIFGQLTHGWELLAKLRVTPRDGSDRPVGTVRIVSAEVVPTYVVTDGNGTRTYTDAVLVLTAKAPGKATITVRADDRRGGVTVQRFRVDAEPDPVNSPPFLSQLGNHTIAAKTQINLPFQVFDLEHDHVRLGYELFDNGTLAEPKGRTDLVTNRIVGVIGGDGEEGSEGYKGPLKLVLAAAQYQMGPGGREWDDYVRAIIGVGEPPITTTAEVVHGEPTALLSQVAVAGVDRDSAAELSASINWGDGTTGSAGSLAAAGSDFKVLGSHTYARAGVYPITVTLTTPGGLLQKVKSAAHIASGPLRAIGLKLNATGRNVKNQVIATFSDTDQSTVPADYAVLVDWGNGLLGAGQVRALAPGSFEIIGKHAYRDAQVYSVGVRISKVGEETGTTATAWTTVDATGFASKPYLPPFAASHLVGELNRVLVDPNNQAAGVKEFRTTVPLSNGTQQTYLTLSTGILNSGNKKSPAGKLQFFLSPDTTLNKVAVTTPGGGSIPADTPLKIGKASRALIPAIKPGRSVGYTFDKSTRGDFRLKLPPNKNGDGYYLICALTYSDPIGKHLAIEREIVVGPLGNAAAADMATATESHEEAAEPELDPDLTEVVEEPTE